jgi:hypothetical protein
MNRTRRQILALTLVVIGFALMLTTPDSYAGLVVLGCAVLIEAIGLTLQKGG